MDMKVVSTVGYEREHNPILAVRDEDEFVRRAVGTLGPQPPNFHNIVALNRGPLSTDPVDLQPLTPRQVELKRSEGAFVVDVRTDQQFDDAHIPGAVGITILRAGFGSKLAWLADPETEIVLVGRDDDDARQAAELAASVGVTRIGGYLHGGMTTWREERRPTQSIPRLRVDEVHERWSGDGLQILDVRERAEHDTVRIPGSLFTPYHDLHGLPEGLDPHRPVAVVCASGQRAAVAASLLQRHGAEEVIHVVDGGVGTWEMQGFPVER
jgi:rhodanese-related sulfurtransferase